MVEVIRDGIGRASETADLREAAPAFFMFDPDGRKFITAVHTDGFFVGKPDLFGGALPARPAQPGDVILIFGTAFGLTDPPVEAGRLFSGAAPLKADVRILFGGIEADVLFAGLSGAGLNQFNVVVPDLLQGGDIQVVAETLGERTQANAFLTVEGVLNPSPTSDGDTYSGTQFHRGRTINHAPVDVAECHERVNRAGHWFRSSERNAGGLAGTVDALHNYGQRRRRRGFSRIPGERHGAASATAHSDALGG